MVVAISPTIALPKTNVKIADSTMHAIKEISIILLFYVNLFPLVDW